MNIKYNYPCLNCRIMKLPSRRFHKLDKIGNNANIGIRGFTAWKKSSNKMLPPVGIDSLDSKSNTILTSNQRLWEAQALLGVTFCHLIFFSHSEAFNANIDIIANVLCLWKPSILGLDWHEWVNLTSSKKRLHCGQRDDYLGVSDYGLLPTFYNQ